MSTKLHIRVHRKRYGIERCRIRQGLRQPELVCDAIHIPKAMPTVHCIPEVETGQMGQSHDWFCLPGLRRRRQQADRLWLKDWNPEQGLSVRRDFRVTREIANPIAARMFPAPPQSAPAFALYSGNHDDSPRDGGDTPRQSRQGE